MSLTAASRNALSGLTMASLTTRLISDNIANSMTPGYGVRSLGLTSDQNGSGVRILSITRFVDPVLLANLREADARLGAASTMSTFMQRLEGVIGLPGEDGSLSSMVAKFQADLLEAASRPDSSIRLDQAVTSASDLVGAINTAADGVQDLRNTAEKDIASQVDRMNELLVSIDEVNETIIKTTVTGNSAAALMDQRQNLIDELNSIVPVSTVEAENGRVKLYTTGGTLLLDTVPVDVGFTQVNVVTAYASIDAGTLYGLTLNGGDVNVDPDSSQLRGGTLMAAFKVRDVTAVEMQNRLDGLARDLIERFEDAGIDGTRAAGDPGLFTDSGAVLDTSGILGLAQRLELNAAIDPAQGGETWRLRDGLGATVAGNIGDASLIQDLLGAMDTNRTSPTAIGTGSYSMTGLTDYVSSLISSERAVAESDQSYAALQQSEMGALLAAEGVDTDAELQTLLVIEQIYAANAQVLETVDAMLATLMEI
ncbi:MAG: flagellar hook-associated protein FlgK [Pseudomonadota bacterium]